MQRAARVGDAHGGEPGFELGRAAEAEQIADEEGVVEGGALVAEHDVVGAGDAHDEVDAGGGEQGEQGVHVVLVGVDVVGVADIDPHGEAEEFAAEVVFEAGADDLFAVEEVLGPDEADDGVDEQGAEGAGDGVGASLAGLLIDAVVGVGGEGAALAGLEVHAVAADGAAMEREGGVLRFSQESEGDAEARIGLLGAGDGLEDEIDRGADGDGLEGVGDVGQDASLNGGAGAKAELVEQAEQMSGRGDAVRGGIDADDGVAGAVEDAVDDRGEDACGIVGGVIGLKADGEGAGEADGGTEGRDDAAAAGGQDEVLVAHELGDGGGHLWREAGADGGE